MATRLFNSEAEIQNWLDASLKRNDCLADFIVNRDEIVMYRRGLGNPYIGAIKHFLARLRVSVLPHRDDVLLEDLSIACAGNSAFSFVSANS